MELKLVTTILMFLTITIYPLLGIPQSKGGFEVGVRMGICSSMKINKVGGNDNARFSSNFGPSIGIEFAYLRRVIKNFSIGPSIAVGGYSSYMKITYGETDYVKAHPRSSSSASINLDNPFFEIGAAIAYQLKLRKDQYLCTSVTPKIYSVPYPGGDTGLELVEPDSTKQIAYNIDFSNYPRKQFKGGCNVSLYLVKERRAYFYIGIFASIVPSSFKGDYVVFPGTSDYAYGNIAIRLSSYGVKAGIGFRRSKK